MTGCKWDEMRRRRETPMRSTERLGWLTSTEQPNRSAALIFPLERDTGGGATPPTGHPGKLIPTHRPTAAAPPPPPFLRPPSSLLPPPAPPLITLQRTPVHENRNRKREGEGEGEWGGGGGWKIGDKFHLIQRCWVMAAGFLQCWWN